MNSRDAFDSTVYAAKLRVDPKLVYKHGLVDDRGVKAKLVKDTEVAPGIYVLFYGQPDDVYGSLAYFGRVVPVTQILGIVRVEKNETLWTAFRRMRGISLEGEDDEYNLRGRGFLENNEVDWVNDDNSEWSIAVNSCVDKDILITVLDDIEPDNEYDYGMSNDIDSASIIYEHERELKRFPEKFVTALRGVPNEIELAQAFWQDPELFYVKHHEAVYFNADYFSVWKYEKWAAQYISNHVHEEIISQGGSRRDAMNYEVVIKELSSGRQVTVAVADLKTAFVPESKYAKKWGR